MVDEFVVTGPNGVIRRFERTDSGYRVYIWEREWALYDHVSVSTAESYFNFSETYIKRKKKGPELFRMRLISFMSLLDEDNIHREGGEWYVSTEWLVGGFAGRVFVSSDLDSAVDEMIEYFDRHLGHSSFVGDIVKKSGWPDITKLRAYLTSEDR